MKFNLKNKPYIKVAIQIFLVVTMSIAFSYIIDESDNIVSAQEVPASDSGIINTCLNDCQEYLSSSCSSSCGNGNGICIPASRANTACKLGTCYDSVEGICMPNSPNKTCVENGGIWGIGNLLECRVGCCVIGDETELRTEQSCNRIEETSGIPSEFKPEVNTETECRNLARTQVEGACITGTGEDRVCTFGTRSACLSEDGDFEEGFLCSHPDLETGCEKQASTNCVNGKDGVYWIDGCGNKENIYEGSNLAQKESSWNTGLVKPRSESCNINGFSLLGNQGTCGNCDRLASSTTCGGKTAEEKLDDSSQDVVCKTLSCFDENNQRRENGERWCNYQGSVLPAAGDRGFNRSTATPGSTHYVMECREGEVQIYRNCADMRTEICEEVRVERTDGNGYISYAKCTPNLADLCLSYNDKEDAAGLCETNPQCYMKQLNVKDSKLRANICVPKYPKGFDLSTENGQTYAQSVCSVGTISCKYAWVKTAFHGKKWINKGCKKVGFTQQMNDFCMSLGDCGASVNYIGDLGLDGYKVTRAPALSAGYLDEISNYSNSPDSEEYIQMMDGETIRNVLYEGGAELSNVGTGDFPDVGSDKTENFYENSWPYVVQGVTAVYLSWGGLASMGILGMITTYFYPIIGAFVGTTITAWLFKYWGIATGLTATESYVLLGAAAIASALVTLSIIGGAASTTLAALGPIGWITLAVIVAIALIMRWTGVGKMEKHTATFTCSPWTPPEGINNCDKCGEDGFPCNNYACESLGSDCEFVNEGTSQEICDYIPSTLTPPIIKPNYNVITADSGFIYENETSNGFKIVNTETDDGCFPGYSSIIAGISLNERGRCTWTVDQAAFAEGDVAEFLDEAAVNLDDFGFEEEFIGESIPVGAEESLQDYEEGSENEGTTTVEEFYFGGSNFDLYNHTQPIQTPSLARLGLSEFDPNMRLDFDMKVRCKDTGGHKNPTDYTIRMCLSPQERIVPPYVKNHEPANGKTKQDAIEQNISVYTDVPAECKWSLSDKEYSIMENSFACKNEDGQQTTKGFKCDSKVPMNENNKTISVRCRDQPWNAETSSNIMDESYTFSLEKSSALEITSIVPIEGSELSFGTEPAAVTVSVSTNGGADNGKSTCSYLVGNFYIDIGDGMKKTHSQLLDQYTQGEKTLVIKCEDSVGNIATGTSNFNIAIDTEAPRVSRVFKSGSQLKIITNEKAVCYYDYKKCDFDTSSAKTMSIGLSTEHAVNWNPGAIYYIKCKDTWNNWDSKCSIIIKPEEII